MGTTAGAPSNNSQQSYHETPYEDQDFEVVGVRSPHDSFVPMEIDTVDGERMTIDPMFPDYGGRYGSPGVKRPYVRPGEVVKKKTQEQEDTEQGILRIKKADIDRAIEEARAQAREEALAALSAEHEQRLRDIEERVHAIFRDYQSQIGESMSGIERSAADLAVAISEKVVGYAVEINPEYIIPVVQDALKLVGSAHVARVRVSPQDMEFIEVLHVQSAVRDFAEFKFEADDTIRSGCVVDTSAGAIDFQLDKAWERVRDDVVKAIS